MKKILLTLLLIGVRYVGFSQNIGDTVTSFLKATDYSIPTSPAFSLLGVTPNNVSTPGFTKDIKLSNFIVNGNILDNIAFDAQPFWILLMRNKSIRDYQNSGFSRYLSRINLSIGTTTKNGQRNFAYSGKITLGRDPMMDTNYINDLNYIIIINSQKDSLLNTFNINMTIAKKKLEKETNPINKFQLKKEIDSLKNRIKFIQDYNIVFAEKYIKKLKEMYEYKHWGDFVIDIGIGELLNYSNPNIDSLKFKSTGYGVWINPAWGYSLGGENNTNGQIKFAGIGKFIIIDTIKTISFGGNIRYGSPKGNIFIEYSYEKTGSIVNQIISFGGEIKFDKDHSILFGLKRIVDKDFKLLNLYPNVSISWSLDH